MGPTPEPLPERRSIGYGCRSSEVWEMRSGVIVLGAMLAGCSVAPAQSLGPAPSASTTTPTSTATTTVPAATTRPPLPPAGAPTEIAGLTHPDALPPAVDLEAETFEELIRVWDDIDRYLVWLYAHPTTDEAALALVLQPGSRAYEDIENSMRTLVDRGARTVQENLLGELVAFSCCPDPDTEMVVGRVAVAVQSRADPGHMVIIGEDGGVLAESSGWDLREWALVLEEGGAGWRVSSFGD